MFTIAVADFKGNSKRKLYSEKGNIKRTLCNENSRWKMV